MNFMALIELIITILLFSHLLACSWTILHRVEKIYLNVQ